MAYVVEVFCAIFGIGAITLTCITGVAIIVLMIVDPDFFRQDYDCYDYEDRNNKKE